MSVDTIALFWTHQDVSTGSFFLFLCVKHNINHCLLIHKVSACGRSRVYTSNRVFVNVCFDRYSQA